jgi:hypothetical protein
VLSIVPESWKASAGLAGGETTSLGYWSKSSVQGVVHGRE